MITGNRSRSCPTPQELSAFRVGQLDDGDLEHFADHLSHCKSCSWRLAIDASGDAQLGRLRSAVAEPPSPDEWMCRPVAGAPGEESPTRHEGRPTGVRLPIPPRLGPYEIIEALSGGGMGDVYKARHVHLKKIFALKTLTADRSSDPAAVARFRREMEASGDIGDHANVVRSTAADEHEGIHYLVMEFITGVDLGRLIAARGPLPIADACELIRQAALGVAHLHSHGHVHRDIKPGNLMLSTAGVVKVLDLGLALLPNAPGIEARLTGTWTVMGTADYMAPEQFFDSHCVTASADIYSLGCTLFKLLTKRVPFEGESSVDLAWKWRAHSLQAPPRVSHFRGDVPPAIDALVERLLSKDPEARGSGAAALAEELTAFAAGNRIGALFDDGFAADAESLAGLTKPIHDATVIQLPKPQPAPRFPKWASWAIAALVGVVMPVLVGATIHWTFPRSDDAPPPLPAGAEAAFEDVEPGVWHNAFEREPKKIAFSDVLDASTYHWERDRDLLAVTYFRSTARLGVGSIPPDHSFKMQVNIKVVRPEQDTVGIFFGHQPQPGSRTPDHQLLVLQKFVGQPNDKGVMQLARYRQRDDALAPIAVAPLPALLEHEYTLRLHYLRGVGLIEVTWDGIAVPLLVTAEANLDMDNDEYAGPFGIYMSSGAATFRHFRYMILDDERE